MHAGADVTADAPPPPAVATGDPELVFDVAQIDFGTMSELETRALDVGFVNAGTAELVIESVSTTCGCTAAMLEQHRYAPGERGTIAVVFDPTAPGMQTKYVRVISNAEPSPASVAVIADVTAFIDIQPRALEVDVLALGETHRFTLEVDGPAPDLEIESVRATNPDVRATLLDADGEGPRTVEVEIRPDAPWGPVFSWIEITGTGRPSPESAEVRHTARVRLQGELFGRVTAAPCPGSGAGDATFRFGVAPGEGFERCVRLTRTDGEPLVIVEALLDAPTLADGALRATQVSPTAWDLVLTATGGSATIPHRGAVLVRTNAPAPEAEIRIDVSGVTRARPAGW